MASRRSPSPDKPAPQSIPLQNLSRPPDDPSHSRQNSRSTLSSRFNVGHGRTPSLLERRQYQPLNTDSPIDPRSNHQPTGIDDDDFLSPVDTQAFAQAHIGLSVEGPSHSSHQRTEPPTILTPTSDIDLTTPPLNDGASILSRQEEDDRIPLTKSTISRSAMKESVSNSGQRHDRHSKRSSVQFIDPIMPAERTTRGSHLGDDLPTLSTDGPARKLSVGSGIMRMSFEGRRSSERDRSRSPSPSPLARAGSMLRDISERVVNISNDSDMVAQNMRKKSTVRRMRQASAVMTDPTDEEIGRDIPNNQPDETMTEEQKHRTTSTVAEPILQLTPPRLVNPLKGRSLGLFGPENGLRKWLLEVLTNPAAEPIILILIVAQTVLLAVNAASNAQYLQPRSRQWGRSSFDYAILGLFVVYTLEIVARTIVSGFITNPTEYSTLDRSQGSWRGAIRKIGSLFDMYEKPEDKVPQRRGSIEFQPSIVRAFTGFPEEQSPGHSRQKQRMRLAKRAFLRHSFNRLDFLAVISYWISFAMQLGGIDAKDHIYVFNMLSCLRILRLLGITGGTTIILRSLKKAAPLLVNIAFLIGFFWLIFGIIGVQSFKSSLRRTCVWVGDDGSGQNYSLNVAPENIQFCGGYLDAVTAQPMPWLKANGDAGATEAKGYFCPMNSLCVENTNPYNNTVSFDNIINSLELVFVVISSNTWSDLMYYLISTDYLAAALFFALGIVVMSLWLVNLLIAVITSCFQIIREESKQSAFTTMETEDLMAKHESKRPRINQLQVKFSKTRLFWLALIVFDLIVMCLRSASMSQWRETFIMDTNTVVTLLLLVEILLRFACDWRYFHHSYLNWVDLLIAIVTTIMEIPPVRSSGTAYAWLTTFQIARVYRIVIAVPVTRGLVMLVFSNALGLINLILFVFLFTFLAAIMASEMFRGDIPADDPAGNSIQIQFYDIWNSFIGMYIIFSSENWTTIVYNITQFNLRWDTAWLGALFCIFWFIMANLIILNMFIAVIQESFDVSEDEKRLQQMKAFLQQKEVHGGATAGGNLAISAIFKMGRDSLRHRDALEYQNVALEQLLKDAVVKDFLEEQTDGQKHRPVSTHLTNLPVPVTYGFLSKLWQKITGHNTKDPNPFYSDSMAIRANEEFDALAVAKQVASYQDNKRKLQRQYLNRHPNYNVSLFIFRPDNPIRVACMYLVGPSRGGERPEGVAPWKPAWFAFSVITYAAILAMVAIACVTTPLYQKEMSLNLNDNNWLVWTDMAFAIVFSLEAIVKIIADGFFYTPNAFFRSIWGLIDVIVLASLWVSVVTTITREDSITRGVGALKALRALRLLNVSDSARKTFHSVIVIGGYKVLSAALVSLSLLIPFAILGLNLFNGQFESCNDNSFSGNLTNCVNEFNNTPFNWNVLSPRTVTNPSYNFDTFGSALFILFQIASQEGWTSVLQSGMAVAGIGQQPQNFSNEGNAVYFIVFNLLGAVFVLTLFISVFMRNYTEQTGVAFLTSDQRSWLELRKLLKQITPAKKSVTDKTKGWQLKCYRLASKKRGKYPRFITTMLLLHLTLLVIEYYPEPAWWNTVRTYLFLAFTIVFMANVFIRIVGLTWDRFRRSSWDIFSLFAVSGSFITTLIAFGSLDNRFFEQLHKLFLVSITFLLIPRNNQLDQLFKTAAASLPLILNLLATWFVLFLVFAIAMTQAFSLTRFGTNENGNVNFRNVPKALILLFRMSIGEGWNSIMEDYAHIQPPFCVMGDTFFDGDCGSIGWARGLFVAWNIISMYIFVSLFVSLIFESFSYVYQRSGGLAIVTREEIRRFKQAWAEFDPDATGYISKEAFPRLLGELSGIFQMRIYDGDFTVRNLIEDCSVQPGEAIGSARIVAGLNLDKLNERLDQIPLGEIRARRRQMNVFYNEMLLSADPEKGISFSSCLMILAHYNVISDSKSLRLEEFLRRRARLQRVDETIRRAIVVKFFDTIRHRRDFKQYRLSRKISSNLEGPPQLAIPEIFIEHPDGGLDSDEEAQPNDFTEAAPLSPRRVSPELQINTNLARHDSTWSTQSPTQLSPAASPTTSPRKLSAASMSYQDDRETTSPPRTPTLGGHSRKNSSVGGVNTQGLMESFDASAWGESLRRSFTIAKRRSDQTQ